jgi:hypothetical protein
MHYTLLAWPGSVASDVWNLNSPMTEMRVLKLGRTLAATLQSQFSYANFANQLSILIEAPSFTCPRRIMAMWN